MRDDVELLRSYAHDHDQVAFTELVQRHIGFVYAAALRQCRGNSALAHDATQLVFTDLARRAPFITTHPALSGWLHTATRFAAMKLIRTENRRLVRDQQAAELLAQSAGDHVADWTQLQSTLDDALNALKERDRVAILLRFFQGKPLSEVGACLRLSETAASSCVDRALDRLRVQLERRGITSSVTALGVVLAQSAATAAPPGLAAVVAGTALTQSAISGAALVPVFAMKKIILTLAALTLVAEFSVATVELRTKQTLEADYARQEVAFLKAPTSAPAPTAANPPSPLSISASPVPAPSAPLDAAEVLRLEQRLRQLKSRPPGVIDARMLSPHPSGRATPRDAMQTVAAAVRDHDFAALEKLVSFNDDTLANRAAFMANFPEATRARYETPERLMIAFIYEEVLRDPPVTQQVLSTHAYSGGVETITTWTQLASGVERRDENPFVATDAGWAFPALPLTGKNIPPATRFDPATGAVLPPKK